MKDTREDKAARRRLLLDRYGHAVPRYTSYPPATRFIAAQDAGQTYARRLAAASGDVSLYFHIPFCMRLCYYCGCHTRVVNDYGPVTDYLALLEKEVAMVRERLSPDCRVSHIHFGGGSPTMLTPDDFSRFMENIRAGFNVMPDAEIGIEADPRNITPPHVAAYAGAGVTRLSLGVQSFDDAVLEAVNRPQPFALTEKAVALCRAEGIGSINFDLMYGLPLQTAEKVLETMKRAVSLSPDRIAYFGYAHVPWMKKHMALLPEGSLPDAAARLRQQEAGGEFLVAAGYIPVGIDHFVRPGDTMRLALQTRRLHRNFQGYTTDGAPTLIGFGASAIGENAAGYCQNASDTKTYFDRISAGEFATLRLLDLAPEDHPRRRVIEALMCYLEADTAAACAESGLPPESLDAELESLQPMAQDGILTLEGRRVIVDPEYRMLVRIVCEAFDQYAQKGEGAAPRHAQAV